MKTLLLLLIFLFRAGLSHAVLPIFPDTCFKWPPITQDPEIPIWFSPPPPFSEPQGAAASQPISFTLSYPQFESAVPITTTTLYCTLDGTDPSLSSTSCLPSTLLTRTTLIKAMAVVTTNDGRKHFSSPIEYVFQFDDRPWGVPREFTIQTDMEFAFVPVPLGEGNAYYIQKTEVTQAQWMRFMAEDGNTSTFLGTEHPMETITWYQIQEFIKRLNEAEGTTLYRLPTQKEWIYAARAFSTKAYPFGEVASQSCFHGAVYLNQPINQGTRDVKSFLPNAFGIYDTIGNVREWTSDLADDNFRRMACGCSYLEKSLGHCKSTHCSAVWPYQTQGNLGFRLVKDL